MLANDCRTMNVHRVLTNRAHTVISGLVEYTDDHSFSDMAGFRYYRTINNDYVLLVYGGRSDPIVVNLTLAYFFNCLVTFTSTTRSLVFTISHAASFSALCV